MNRRFFLSAHETEEDILGVVREVRARGYEIHDVYTPYAVHGLDEAMGLRPSRLPYVCLGMALFGAAAKLWFQIWTSAQSWPVNVGGKPLESVPAFVPVTFEVTVLFAGLGTVAAFFLRSKLRPGKKARPVKLHQPYVVEPGHDANHNDEHRHTQRDAQHGNQRDDRDERPFGPQISQRQQQFERQP